MPLHRRARSPTAKAERRRAILDATEALYDRETIDRIRMEAVAREGGVAKGTVYLYFRTKEELFLALLERALSGWFDELESALSGGGTRLTGARLAAVLADSLVRRPTLRRLLADQGSVIERNLAYEVALRFKWRLVSRMTTAGELLERRTVFLRGGDGARLLLQVHAVVIGLQQQADPAPVVAGILEAPGMDVLAVDIERELGTVLRSLLTGVERTN